MRILTIALFLCACSTSTAVDGDTADTDTDTDSDTDSDADTDTDTDTDSGGGDTDTGSELDGETLYMDNCSECHGNDGTGTREGPDITKQLGRMSDADIIEVILNGAGRNEMPPIDVTEPEAQAIVDYMRANF